MGGTGGPGQPRPACRARPYPGEHAGQGDGRGRRSWRHHALIAGASAAAAGVVIAGLTATDAMAATALTLPQIAAKVDPGLVDVVTTLGYQGGKAAGTGMVLTSTGEVLTNNHVIDGATSIKATDVGNGRTYTAKVVGYDKTHDVAVLQLAGRLRPADRHPQLGRPPDRAEGGRAGQRRRQGRHPIGRHRAGLPDSTRRSPHPTRERATPSS